MLYLYIVTLYNHLLLIAASEAGYDDISEPEDGLISNEDEVADLVDRTRAELGHVIRNPERPTHGTGKPLLNSRDCRVCCTFDLHFPILVHLTLLAEKIE